MRTKQIMTQDVATIRGLASVAEAGFYGAPIPEKSARELFSDYEDLVGIA